MSAQFEAIPGSSDPFPLSRCSSYTATTLAAVAPRSFPRPPVVHLVRRLVIQGLMKTFAVVEPKVIFQPFVNFVHRGVILEVNVLVLHTSPQPLDERVVESPATTVHADRHRAVQEPTREVVTRELHALVAVENLRLRLRQRLLQGLYAKITIEPIRQSPRQHIAAVPIEDGL